MLMSIRPRKLSAIPRDLVLEPTLPNLRPRSFTWRTELFGKKAMNPPMTARTMAKMSAEVGLPDIGFVGAAYPGIRRRTPRCATQPTEGVLKVRGMLVGTGPAKSGMA